VKNNKKTRVVPFDIKAVSETGVFEGYASTFGNKDLDNDVIVKGAFKKTIALKKGKWPILWQHNSDVPAGANISAEEDDHGLKVNGQLFLNMTSGKEAYEWVKGALAAELPVGLSIGYRVVEKAVENGVRLLKEIALVEYSIVTFPANELAEVTTIKSVEDAKAAMDFSEALQQEMSMQALCELRWTIESAKYDAIQSVEEDGTLDISEKLSMVKTIYEQFSAAMVAWWAKYFAIIPADEDDKSNHHPLKAGAKISKETAAKLKDAVDLHKQANQKHRDAMKMHNKAASMVSSVASGYDASSMDPREQTPPANDPSLPTKTAKELEDESTVALLNSLHSKMVA
jgi:Escherichia/Staphylococcus phage prohead protease